MGADEADVNDPLRIVDAHDESIFVPADVEADSVILQEIRASIVGFDVLWCRPVSSLDSLMPGFQGTPLPISRSVR
jgi:hypothetical protein